MGEDDYTNIRNKVVNYLKNIYDPEIPINIYDLGLIYKIEFSKVGPDEKYLSCYIEMTLTSAGCPVSDFLYNQVKYTQNVVDEIDEIDVKIVFDPPWSAENLPIEIKMELNLL